MTACPVCGAPAGAPFLRRAGVPAHQNQPADSAAAARAMPRGTLALATCVGCGLVWNTAFDPALARYGPGYENAQSHSPRFAAHLDALAGAMVAGGARGARIIEVGCGQGEFLRRLVAWPGAGNAGIGFDPAHRGPNSELDGRLRFERRLFAGQGGDAPADIVVCRHVIEHVPDPLMLLRAVRAALAPGGRLFLETPDVAWSLRHRALWDFFYEHCTLFSEAALANACRRAGFAVEQVERVFDGQYLWLEARAGAQAVADDPGDIAALAQACGAARWPALPAGRLALWGAGAKGVTIAAAVDPEAALIDCLVDINPAKQGRFAPGSGHPIVAPADLPARGVQVALPMNPAYRAEIARLLPPGVRLAEWAD